MPMPKAAVHKYHLSQYCEYEIGRSRQVAAVKAVAIAHRVSQSSHR
jgi:hypothetical protein